MLSQFFFLNLFLVSFGVILLLVVRAWPRLDGVDRKGVWERWLTSELPRRMDAFFDSLFLRMLRKVRVMALKMDNAVDAKLQRMKLERGDSIVSAQPRPALRSRKAPAKDSQTAGD